MDLLASVSVLEQQVNIIFYHARRDWERMHLRWRQDMEEYARTGRGYIYAEPRLRSIENIRKECYRTQ